MARISPKGNGLFIFVKSKIITKWFALLPDEQAEEYRSLWEEFDENVEKGLFIFHEECLFEDYYSRPCTR